jgi:hypothetical protein
MVDSIDEVRRDGCEALAEIADVAWVWLSLEKLIDDRQEVVERGNASERRGAVGALSSSGDGEQECGLDDLEGDASVEESVCEAAVGASGEAGRAGCASVEIDHLLGISLTRGHGFRLWRARP